MFGASQLWGKVGRAFLRSISERQYWKFPPNSEFKLGKALEESLRQWRKLVDSGPPRPIDFAHDKIVDAVIFTDGFTPDPRSNDRSPDRIGGVIFDRRLRNPRQFTAQVPEHVKQRWLERTTQIVPIEMLAPVVALATFADRVSNADIFVMIDSESVEGSLIKGYSSREDLCQIISVFWDLALKLRTRVFIDRISTDANPADAPSRNRLEFGARAGWITVPAVWPRVLLGGAWGPGYVLSQFCSTLFCTSRSCADAQMAEPALACGSVLIQSFGHLWPFIFLWKFVDVIVDSSAHPHALNREKARLEFKVHFVHDWKVKLMLISGVHPLSRLHIFG